MPRKLLSKKAKLRIKIARDALKLLNSRKVVPIRTSYCDAGPTVAVGDITKKPCHVCALGVLFLSKVMNTSRPSRLLRDRASVYDELDEIFPTEQLIRMDNLFTRGGSSAVSMPKWFRVKNKRTQLRRMMMSIIQNKGEFRPDLPLKLPKK